MLIIEEMTEGGAGEGVLGLIAFSFLCFLKSYSGGVKLVQREHKVKTVMRNLDSEESSSKRGRRTKNKTI